MKTNIANKIQNMMADEHAALCAVAEAANRVASIGQSTPATWENFNNVVSGHLLPTLAALAAVRGGK